jgi:uncharacterized protein
MNTQEIAAVVKDQLMAYDPVMIGLFGSFARNELNPESDIDILVKFSKSPSLLKLIGIENNLTELLGRKVDLITEGSLKNNRIRSSISRDIRIIFQA